MYQLRVKAAGQAVSVCIKGLLAGYTLSGAYDAPVFLSDTAGAFADAPSTTESIRAGRLTSLSDNSYTKVLEIDNNVILPKIFVSAEVTGNGSSQDTAHGLGVTPTQVFIALTGGPAAYSQPTIVYGTHDATNVKATVTLNWTYRVIAIAA